LDIGPSVSVGFRVFLPFFTLSLAIYFNILELNESWLWIGSTTAAALKSFVSATRLGSTVSIFLPILAIVLVFRLY